MPKWMREVVDQLLKRADELTQKQFYKLGLLLKVSTKQMTKHYVYAYAYCKNKEGIEAAFKKMMKAFVRSRLDDFEVWSVDETSSPRGFRVSELEKLPKLLKKLHKEAVDEVVFKLFKEMRTKDVEIGGDYISIDVRTESRGILYHIHAQADAYTSKVLTLELLEIAQRINRGKMPEIYVSRKTDLEVVDVDVEEGYVWCA